MKHVGNLDRRSCRSSGPLCSKCRFGVSVSFPAIEKPGTRATAVSRIPVLPQTIQTYEHGVGAEASSAVLGRRISHRRHLIYSRRRRNSGELVLLETSAPG